MLTHTLLCSTRLRQRDRQPSLPAKNHLSQEQRGRLLKVLKEHDNPYKKMTLQFYDLDALKEELKQLPHFYRVAFAASICERMLPMYNKFSQMENWGQPFLLREALNEIWLILHRKPIDSSKLRQLIEYLDGENVYPDDQTEDFCHFDYLFEAQFTVSALYSTLTALLTLDLQYIIVA